MRRGTVLGLVLAMGLVAGGATAHAFGRDSLVWEKCTGCHAPKGDKIPRVEEIRTTPEEWTVIVDRMSRLHGMELAKGEMGRLLKELCATQSLAPDEAASVAYLDLFDNPQTMEVSEGRPDAAMFPVCVRCHSAGKIRSYRMTKANWAKLRDFHLYMDPAVIYQMREMHWRDEADKTLALLAQTYPYKKAWQAPKARLAGDWVISGREPGKGTYRGHAKFEDRGDGAASVSGQLVYADGTTEAFSGEATLYGGYAVRTRTRHNGFETMGAFSLDGDVLTGRHHFPAPEFRTSSSTWHRQDGKARVLRVTPGYLLAGVETTVVIEGMNLPNLSARNLSFAGGKVDVRWVKPLGPDAIEAGVVSRSTASAVATLRVGNLDGGSVALAPKIDYIAVSPGTGRARIEGGNAYPAEGVQFEATAFSNGPDVWNPADDIALGPVPAMFHLEEEVTRPGDDDLKWVGEIQSNGTFLPHSNYGPVKGRPYGSEASGWVKVVASYQDFSAEAHLAVTEPDFIQRIR